MKSLLIVIVSIKLQVYIIYLCLLFFILKLKFCAKDNAKNILEFSNACPFQYNRNTFSCVYCPFTTPDFGPLKNHTEEHKVTVMEIKKLESKTIIMAEVSDLRCDLCQEKMINVTALFEHLIITHEKPLDRNSKLGVVPYLLNDGFSCADCDQTFEYFLNLHVHMNEHYPNFICPKCGRSFTVKRRLRMHLLTHNKNQNRFKCYKCDEKFPTSHRMRSHLLSKHGIFPYKCPYCDESFEKYTLRVKHLNDFHDKNIQYPCSLCDKAFTNSSSRAKHMKSIHVNIKEFTCPF